MKSKKETLIETLRGSTEQLHKIPQLLEGVSVYDDQGYVDNPFLFACLSSVNDFMNASKTVVETITGLLGPCGTESETAKKTDEGKSWSVEEILKHCTLEDNVMKLPRVQFNKKSYADAKKWIEEAGGSWTGGKVQGFTFPFNAEREIGRAHV